MTARKQLVLASESKHFQAWLGFWEIATRRPVDSSSFGMDSFSADYWQLTNRDTYELFCLFPCNPNPLSSMDDYLNRLCFQFLKEADQKKHFTSKGSYSQSMVRKHNRRLAMFFFAKSSSIFGFITRGAPWKSTEAQKLVSARSELTGFFHTDVFGKNEREEKRKEY